MAEQNYEITIPTNLVKFNKGSVDKILDGSLKAVKDNFYLAEDARRLYVGISTGENSTGVALLNSSINVFNEVAEFNDLTGKPDYKPVEGDIAFIKNQTKGSTTTAINALVMYNGTEWVQINMPTDVSSIVADLNNTLKLNGGTMKGYITLHATPTNDMHAATKKYVDDAKANVIGETDDTQEDITVYGTRAYVAAEKEALVGKSSDATTADTIHAAKNAAAAAQTTANGALSRATGGTMAGYITLHAAPTNDMHAATKKYVDDAKSATIGTDADEATANTVYGAKAYTDVAKADIIGKTTDAATANTIHGVKNAAANAQAKADNALSRVNGGTMAGNITMGEGTKITGIATPTGDTDAANKKYVDDAKADIIGKDGDAGTANTIYGAKKFAKDAADAVQAKVNDLTNTIGNLTNVMNFIGVSSTDPLSEDGVTIESYTNPAKGDVVVYGALEYVYTGSEWEIFGNVTADESRFAKLEGLVGDYAYALTQDTTKVSGKTYYVLTDGSYEIADSSIANPKEAGCYEYKGTQGLCKTTDDIKQDVRDIKDINATQTTNLNAHTTAINTILSQLEWGTFE